MIQEGGEFIWNSPVIYIPQVTGVISRFDLLQKGSILHKLFKAILCGQSFIILPLMYSFEYQRTLVPVPINSGWKLSCPNNIEFYSFFVELPHSSLFSQFLRQILLNSHVMKPCRLFLLSPDKNITVSDLKWVSVLNRNFISLLFNWLSRNDTLYQRAGNFISQ